MFYYGGARNIPIHMNCDLPSKTGYAVQFHTTTECVKLWDELSPAQKKVAAGRWPYAKEDYIFHARPDDDYILSCRLI
jgi:hypothetical protein